MGTQEGRRDLFFRNRIPCGAQSRSQWAPESGTCLSDSAGVKRAAHWPGLTSQRQHRKCLADLNVRAPNLFWLPREHCLPRLSCRQQRRLGGSNGVSARGRAVLLWALHPAWRSRGEHIRGQQAARGARRYPGRRPAACCWDPVSRSCFLEESCDASRRTPQEEPDEQTVVNAAAPPPPW